MKENFFITTPIYYWNWMPHIGHFYTSTIANTIYIYNKISGKNCRFTTWIDENSQKSVLKAEEKQMGIWEYLDMMADAHREAWDLFGIRYTDFIRTTEERHHKLVREVLQKCFDKWDIYEWMYEWMYCVWCEAFKKEDDLIEVDWKKVCADHLKEPEYLKEKNYFFRLSKYENWLKGFYKSNSNFVMPDFRFNEVKAFVDRGLEDFSISRESNTFGIPLPFDEWQVTYVWFDALFNYYTSCKYSRWWNKNNTDWTDESEFWIRKEPKNNKILHNVWKDIIRFHAIFWPCMLASYFDLWEEKESKIVYKESDLSYLPNNILTWGFFTVDGQKMSKTIWNVIDPIEYTKKYNKELLSLYILSSISIWNDWDYDRKEAILMYNAKLANNFWNLINRAVVLTMKLELESEFEAVIDERIWKDLEEYIDRFDWFMNKLELKNSLDATFAFLDEVNQYVTEKEPWALMKDESKIEEAKNIMYTILESIRQVTINLYSFFPEKMDDVFKSIALDNYKEELGSWKIYELRQRKEKYYIKEKSGILFEKFDLE